MRPSIRLVASQSSMSWIACAMAWPMRSSLRTCSGGPSKQAWGTDVLVQRAPTVQRMPAGPAVVITPWNAPFMLATWKVAPALAAGNSVVLKPAEWSPLSASLLADLTTEARLPPGAFNLVQGIGSEVGAALTADPRVRCERSREVAFCDHVNSRGVVGVLLA